VDCSPSDAVAERYAGWLAAGLHVVTPNKHAGSGRFSRYRAIRDAARPGTAEFRYDTTVGAGLPVIQTLRELIAAGDDVRAIDGVLSGTLAWLCDRFDGRRPFSALVREAHAAGVTEPDPRDDLSGADAARKLVILARELSRPLTVDAVQVDDLVPEALRGAPLAEFLARLELLDPPLAARLAEARAAGGVLRHVVHWGADDGARVGLVVLPRHHPFADLASSENVVQFTTRARPRPVVVQGPGAGPAVTAERVLAELRRVAVPGGTA
jgi:aspartokinase/homoserine dehydrogenase 1